jgi:alpha-ribazole phosphatase/probable phosphoglycerate mutase
VYETHSISVDNERGVATGWLPGELSERGKALAVELGARRRDDGLVAVYTSDLRRARQTVDIAFEGCSIPVYEDRRLRECDYGDLNGAPVATIERIRAAHVDEPFPGGQSYRDVVRQVADLLREIAEQWGEGAGIPPRVLLVGHAATRFALDHLLTGADLAAAVVAPFRWREGWEYDYPPRDRSVAIPPG